MTFSAWKYLWCDDAPYSMMSDQINLFEFNGLKSRSSWTAERVSVNVNMNSYHWYSGFVVVDDRLFDGFIL